MEITADTYTISLHPGETQYDLYENITEVVDEFATNDQFFIARLSEEQVITLRNDSRVIGVDNMMEAAESIEDDGDNTLSAHRVRASLSSSTTPGRGNWGLKRHTSLTNNFAAEDTDYAMGFSYPQTAAGADIDGTGVDIVACLGQVPDVTNLGYQTNSVSRIERFQWNTLPGLSALSAIDYTTPGQTASSSSRIHSEAVLAFACHNTYGWAKGAKIYIMPRSWETYAHWWEAVRLFHQAKVAAGGTVRPTVMIQSFGYNWYEAQYGFINVHFRGTDYNSHRGLNGKSGARSRMNETDSFGMPFTIRRSAYVTMETLVANMENQGVFNVVTNGNGNQKLDVPGGVDYNNHIWSARAIASWQSTPPNPPFYTSRQTAQAGPHTIIVGSMQSAFDSIITGRETLSATSPRGPRVDCVMGGVNLTLKADEWGGPAGSNYRANGTSFVAPQVGGILAMVLQKYPNTTQAQARKYFRDHAIGTDKLYDPGKPPISDGGDYGDPNHFATMSLCGYSGNILYVDPLLSFDPSTITDTTITSPETLSTSKINFTVAEINAKLASIP
tara:strand:- start:1901 stop:3574 length:1674 start_codon:yes stop_codon:yes gene_type:complete